jgi:hypothetical protein
MTLKYDQEVLGYAGMAAAIGVPGAVSFGLDILALGGLWGTMLYDISTTTGHSRDKNFYVKIGGSVATSLAAYIAGSKILVTLLNAIPGAGTGAAIALNSTLNGLYTWRLGQAFLQLFDKPDINWDDVETVAEILLQALTPKPTKAELLKMYKLLKRAKR